MQQIPQVQPVQTQPWEVDDFSGGVTDYYLDAPRNKAKTLDNLLIVKHGDKGKLINRQGSEIYNATYYQIPAGNQRIQSLKLFESELLIFSKEKVHYIDSGWQTIQGPTSNNLFPSSATTSDVLSMATWNKHLLVTSDGFFRPQMIYPNASNVLTLRTAGLPELATSPTVTAGGAGTESYIYAFVHYYSYTFGSVTREMYGPVTQVSLASAAAPNSSAVSVTAIPVLANSTTHNYDTTTIKIKIYRTITGGTTFYYVGQVTNGTTTYSDTTSDTTLQTSSLLYTEGGTYEHEQPPLAKLVHVVGGKSFWAHTKDGTEVFANRFYQSIPGIVTAVPSDFYEEVDEAIVGLSSVKSVPILLCEAGAVYRVDGAIDEFGRGGLFPQKIAENAACVSGQSVVQTLDGVFWAGLDGVYFTDGNQVLKLNEDYDRTWATFVATTTQRSRIQGKYDSLRRRVWWTIQSADASDCDKCYILDLNWGIRPKATFTTASGGTNFAPTALEFNSDEMIRADKRGYLFNHTDTTYSDPKVNLNVAPSSWETAVLTYDYVSPGFNFGTSFERKFVPRVNVICDNETNLSLQVNSINDDRVASDALKPIRFRGGFNWDDDDVIWGDDDLIWNQAGIIDEWRRFPHLRCEYKQIQLTNAFVAITNSDQLGTCTVSSSAKTATLTDVTKSWLSTIVDYYISFSSDSYVREYLITARTSGTVITFSDATNACPNASGLSWVIRGYPRNEALNLLSYTIHYQIFSKTQATYRSTATGEVGA